SPRAEGTGHGFVEAGGKTRGIDARACAPPESHCPIHFACFRHQDASWLDPPTSRSSRHPGLDDFISQEWWKPARTIATPLTSNRRTFRATRARGRKGIAVISSGRAEEHTPAVTTTPVRRAHPRERNSRRRRPCE